MPRVMVFIDASNLSYRLDCVKLVERLLKGRTLVDTHVYGSQSDPPWEKRTRFFRHISAHRFNLHIFEIPPAARRGQEKQVDVALAVDLLWYAFYDSYDVAILVSGDGDFIPAVQKVVQLGKSLEVAAFTRNLSPKLQKECSDIHFLDPLEKELLLGRWVG